MSRTGSASLRFQPAQRLRQKRQFDKVYQQQSRRSADVAFTVLVRPNAEGLPRLGLSVPAKAVGNAVARNRIKRLARESFRLNQHALPSADIVVNARSGVRAMDNDAILRSLARHWHNVILACARS